MRKRYLISVLILVTSYCTVFVISKSVDISIIKEEESQKSVISSVYSEGEANADSRDKRRVGLARYLVKTNPDTSHAYNKSSAHHSDYIPWGTK